jgi:hypothetical protein
VTHVLALETPNGAIAVFTSPVAWGAQGPTPTLNGRTLTEGYTVLSGNQVSFAVPPQYDDVVGFFVPVR